MKVLQLPLGMRTVIIALGANLHFYLDSHEIIRQSTAIINWTNPASQNLIFCNPQQYCIGESCELTCNQTHSRKIALNMKHDFISTVDIENSKDCIFYFPSDCEKCICVARTSLEAKMCSSHASRVNSNLLDGCSRLKCRNSSLRKPPYFSQPRVICT